MSRFQEGSYALDDLAAQILALPRSDLPVMTMLLFGGASSSAALADALHIAGASVDATLERLQLAGYARYEPGSETRVALTAHARRWIERIWAPLRRDGDRLMATYPTAHLAIVGRFLEQACAVQESQTRKLRTWLAQPSSSRRSHVRGGLSPAALRRVQVFVEANLAEPLHLRDLAARAALSPYHFSRAFKTSVGVTPRVFVEQRRVERAKALLADARRPIAVVALEAGFGNQSRLTTVFKRHTRFTPGVYRRGRA